MGRHGHTDGFFAAAASTSQAWQSKNEIRIPGAVPPRPRVCMHGGDWDSAVFQSPQAPRQHEGVSKHLSMQFQLCMVSTPLQSNHHQGAGWWWCGGPFFCGRTRGVASARARIWPCCLAAPLILADPPPHPSHRKIGKTTELHESCVRCEIAHSMGQTSAATACLPACLHGSILRSYSGGVPVESHLRVQPPRRCFWIQKAGRKEAGRCSAAPETPNAPQSLYTNLQHRSSNHTLTHTP
jgi:hypothetical protein